MSITMKYLEELGIEKEVATKIFAERGKEIEESNHKYSELEKKFNETEETLKNTNAAFEELKNSNASKEDWKKKYNELVEANRLEAEKKEKEELAIRERAEFDKYFTDNGKEWAHEYIADGYFLKFQAEKALEENKAKTTADILANMTKDDATSFKVAQPIVNLVGGSPINSNDDEEARINAIMGIKEK